MKYLVYRVPNDQRMQLASLFLSNRAVAWFHNWNRGRTHTWEELEKGICSRFGDERFDDSGKVDETEERRYCGASG